SPGVPAAPGAVTSPAAPGVMPSTGVGAPGMSPPVSGAPGTSPGVSAAPGAMPSPVVSATVTAASASPAAAASPAAPAKSGWTNFLIDNFNKGGPIMWP